MVLDYYFQTELAYAMLSGDFEAIQIVLHSHREAPEQHNELV